MQSNSCGGCRFGWFLIFAGVLVGLFTYLRKHYEF